MHLKDLTNKSKAEATLTDYDIVLTRYSNTDVVGLEMRRVLDLVYAAQSEAELRMILATLDPTLRDGTEI